MLWSPHAEDAFRRMRRHVVKYPRAKIRTVCFGCGSSVILSLRYDERYTAITPGYQEVLPDGDKTLIYHGWAVTRNGRPYATFMLGIGRSHAEMEMMTYRVTRALLRNTRRLTETLYPTA